jgi:hypothetical protein
VTMLGPMKRPAVSAALRPVLDYFDKRFQDLHDHMDERIQRVEARVATEVETISELTLGMQRFVDTSVRQVGELVTVLRDLPVTGETAALLSFALAAGRDLPAGARVVETGWPGPTLGATLTLLDVGVTRLDAVELDQWPGPDEPLDALFWAGRVEDVAAADRLDLFRKWLRPGGFAVLAVMGPAPVDPTALPLADWEVALQRPFEQGLLLRVTPST